MFRFSLLLLFSSTMLPAATTQAPQFRRPLVFEPNRGQAPAPVNWLARGEGYELFLTSEGLTITMAENTSGGEPKPTTLRIKLDGSRRWTDVTGLEPTGGVSNYVRGSNLKTSLTLIP